MAGYNFNNNAWANANIVQSSITPSFTGGQAVVLSPNTWANANIVQNSNPVYQAASFVSPQIATANLPAVAYYPTNLGGTPTAQAAAPKLATASLPAQAYQPSILGGTPIAQYSQTVLPQVQFSGQVSPNMQSGSALPPDPKLGTTLLQQQQDLKAQQTQLETRKTLGQIDQATYTQQSSTIQSELSKVTSDWNDYSKQMYTYYSQPTRLQTMLASVITGYRADQPTFSNPQTDWQHSSMRVYQNGQWVTMPESYTAAYGGDPYADITTQKFQQLSLANSLVNNAEKVQHAQVLAAKQPTGSGQSGQSTAAQSGPAQVSVAGQTINAAQMQSPVQTATAAQPTGPTMWDNIKPYMTPHNIALVLGGLVALIVISKMFGGHGDDADTGSNGDT